MFGDLIQAISTVVTLGAVIVALRIATTDRKHAAEIAELDRAHAFDIAETDRKSSAHQARLIVELDAARRLAILEARGGHTDSAISKDMGAETLALIGFLGPDRVPRMWDRRVGKTDEELSDFINNDAEPQFLRDSVEAEQAMVSIAREMRSLE